MPDPSFILAPPTLALHLALVAATLGAIDGAYGVVGPAAAAQMSGVTVADGSARDTMRAHSAARFLSHAVVLAALWRAPAVGACFAAAVGSGWLGSAAVRAFAGLRRRSPREIARTLAAFALGSALWWPLWLYLATLRAVAAGGAAA